MAGVVTPGHHQQHHQHLPPAPPPPHLPENTFYHHGCMSLERSVPLPYSILQAIQKQEEEGRWRRGREERERREGGREKGKETEGNIWKMLMFPAGFYLCLLYCHVIISNSKEDWEIFLDKHIASLNKIKVLWVRKKKKTYSRREAGSILGKQQSTMEV